MRLTAVQTDAVNVTQFRRSGLYYSMERLKTILSNNGFALVKTKNVNGEKSLSKYRLSETTKKIKVQKLMHRTNLLRFEIQYSSLLQ